MENLARVSDPFKWYVGEVIGRFSHTSRLVGSFLTRLIAAVVVVQRGLWGFLARLATDGECV